MSDKLQLTEGIQRDKEMCPIPYYEIGCGSLWAAHVSTSIKNSEQVARAMAAAPEMKTLLEEELKYLDMWMEFIKDRHDYLDDEQFKVWVSQMKDRKEFIELTLKKATSIKP